MEEGKPDGRAVRPRPARTRVLRGLGFLIVSAGVSGAFVRVLAHERNELVHESPARSLGASSGEGDSLRRTVLTSVALQKGESVLVELCADGPLLPERWADRAAVELFFLEARERVLETPLTDELLRAARRNERGACVIVAQTSALGVGGEYVVQVAHAGLPGEAKRVPLRARVQAYRPLTWLDKMAVPVILFGALVLLFAFFGVREPRAAQVALSREVARIALGVLALVASSLALAFVPLFGSTFGLVRGLTLAAVQVGAALLLLGPARRQVLLGPRVRGWLLAMAVPVGVLTRLVASVAARVVGPSAVEAPIETFVSMPSGALAFATLGVLVPLVEELFFRGFIYGLAERPLGRVGAFVAAFALFLLAHLPQAWGALDSIASLAVAGAVFTGLRAATRSLTVPILAHLTYNALIVAFAWG